MPHFYFLLDTYITKPRLILQHSSFFPFLLVHALGYSGSRRREFHHTLLYPNGWRGLPHPDRDAGHLLPRGSISQRCHHQAPQTSHLWPCHLPSHGVSHQSLLPRRHTGRTQGKCAARCTECVHSLCLIICITEMNIIVIFFPTVTELFMRKHSQQMMCGRQNEKSLCWCVTIRRYKRLYLNNVDAATTQNKPHISLLLYCCLITSILFNTFMRLHEGKIRKDYCTEEGYWTQLLSLWMSNEKW